MKNINDMTIREALQQSGFNFKTGKVYGFVEGQHGLPTQLVDEQYLARSIQETGGAYYALDDGWLHVMALAIDSHGRTKGVPVAVHQDNTAFVTIDVDKFFDPITAKSFRGHEILVGSNVRAPIDLVIDIHLAGYREWGIYFLGFTEQNAIEGLLNFLKQEARKLLFDVLSEFAVEDQKRLIGAPAERKR